MTLQDWVRAKGGAVKTSRLLGVTPHAVRTWVRRENYPRLSMMTKIARKSGLTFIEIVSSCSPKEKRSSRC